MSNVKRNPPIWAQGCPGCTLKPMHRYKTPQEKKEAQRKLLMAAKPYIDVSKI